MLDKLLLQARSMGASDLHLTPVSVPMVRVDGSLQPLQNEFISRKAGAGVACSAAGAGKAAAAADRRD